MYLLSGYAEVSYYILVLDQGKCGTGYLGLVELLSLHKFGLFSMGQEDKIALDHKLSCITVLAIAYWRSTRQDEAI